MAKKKVDDIDVIIDFDKGIDLFNSLVSEEDRQSRSEIYENEEITKTTIQNFKKGKVPSSWKAIFSFLERTGLKLEDIMSVKRGKKKIF